MKAQNVSVSKNLSSGIDWLTLALFLSLTFIGLLMIYAVEYKSDTPQAIYDFSTSAGKQLIWIGISMFALIIIMVLDWKIWRTFSFLLYFLGLFLLVLVLIFGKEINGAKAWFAFGGVSFQPVEVAKLATCLTLANFLSAYDTDLKEFRSRAIAIGLIFLPVSLILLQPDAGSSLVFMSFFILLFREGFNPIYYVLAIIFTTLFILALVFEAQMVILGLGWLTTTILFFNHKSSSYWYSVVLYLLLTISGIILLYVNIQLFLYVAIVAGVLFLIYFLMQTLSGNTKIVIPSVLSLVVGSVFVFSANYAFNNVLKPHQQERINVWLKPEKCDPRGALYNVLQSKMAIGSGGIQGKGYLEGTMTKLNYVPEQSTDFIFVPSEKNKASSVH